MCIGFVHVVHEVLVCEHACIGIVHELFPSIQGLYMACIGCVQGVYMSYFHFLWNVNMCTLCLTFLGT